MIRLGLTNAILDLLKCNEKDEKGFPIRKLQRLQLVLDVNHIDEAHITVHEHVGYSEDAKPQIVEYDCVISTDIEDITCRLPTYQEILERGSVNV